MGRAVREGEPLWLPEDRAWAFALLHVEADSCPECRQPWGEATDRENASAQAVRAYQDKGGNSEGLHVHLERSTD